MGALFNGTSQYLENPTTPIAAYPFTIACWCYVAALGTSSRVWQIADTATANERWAVSPQDGGATPWRFASRAGGVNVNADTATAVVTGAWSFLVARGISATNRRLAVLNPNGSVSHAQNTTSSTPSGLDIMTVGAGRDSAAATGFLNGTVAELTIWNVDIQSDGGQMNEDMLRQLAYGGPFSLTHVSHAIREYRSLFQLGPSAGEVGGEVYTGAGLGTQNWSNVGTTLGGIHPPLPYWYRRPIDRMAVVIV